jgi:hypothetical protein
LVWGGFVFFLRGHEEKWENSWLFSAGSAFQSGEPL